MLISFHMATITKTCVIRNGKGINIVDYNRVKYK